MGAYATKIAAIETAIDNLVSGTYTEASFEGRMYKKADLPQLQSLHRYYKRLESNSGSFGMTFFKTTQPGSR